MKAMFRPLMDYIEENTGAHFDIIILPTYGDMLNELTNGFVHFAAVNAVSFLKLRRNDSNIRYLASSIRSFGDFERDNYLGYIIAPKNSPINSFDDLRDKIFGFVEESSGSGYKMPRAMLGLRGESPDTFFKKYFFLGDHDEVAKAVKNGCVDAGATWEASYRINVKRYGDIFKIVLETPRIPNDAWVIRPEMPEEIGDKIKELLLGLDITTKTNDGRLVLDPELGLPETGFAERSPEFYEKAAPLLLYEELAKQ